MAKRLLIAGESALVLAVVLTSACSTPPPVPYDPPPPSLRRLTQAQYTNSIHDIFGDAIVVAGQLEPDAAISGFLSVGSSKTSISQRGTAQYETVAYDVAHQVVRARASMQLVPCQPTGPKDTVCAAMVMAPLGRRLFRRSLTDQELGESVDLVATAGTTLGDFYAGLEFGIAQLLQSDQFLFRVELGEPDPDAPAVRARYTALDLASRLAFFLWDGPPDENLLLSAEQGGLNTSDGVAAQVARMLASPLARRGLRAFVTEELSLYELDDLTKDPTVFTQANEGLGSVAREETLADFERLVFDLDGDLRDIMTTRDTVINKKLASLYGVRAPSLDGFAMTTLPAGQPRLGLLGQASFLALQAHPTTSSPTLRGKFIRNVLLCQQTPEPPVNLNTGLPMVSPTARTMRERLAAHQSQPVCAACHRSLDNLGLALENFDGLGFYRTQDNGEPIDPSGALDGNQFAGPVELAQLLHDNPDFSACFARRLFRYAVGHEETVGEEPFIGSLVDGQAAAGYRVRELMAAIAQSDAFRRTALPGSN